MKYISTILFVLSSFAMSAQNSSHAVDSTIAWYPKARLGVSITWGDPTVANATAESDYKSILKSYTTKNYKPVGWVKSIQESGAKYMILNVQNINTVTQITKQDFIYPLVKTLADNHIKTGLDYSPFLSNNTTAYKIGNGVEEWGRTKEFCPSQVKKAFNQYSPNITMVCNEWINENPKNWNLDKITSQSESSKLKTAGNDLTRFINEMPLARPESKYWEYVTSMNNYTSHELINLLVDCISMDGNMVLNLTPKADGSLQPEQTQKMKDLGRWVKKHQEVVYNTTAGIPGGHFTGATALSADRQTLYLFIDGKPTGPILVKGLQNKIYRTRIVGDGTIVEAKEIGKMYWSEIPGLLYIDLPEDRLDSDVTVVAILLDSPVKLFREDVKAIESNL